MCDSETEIMDLATFFLTNREQHGDDSAYIMLRSAEQLRETVRQWPAYAWRIKELRPEIFENTAKGDD